MFTRIQARGYRCLRSVDQELGAFCALVGPNASGKTTFLDVIGVFSDLIRYRGDVQEVTTERSATFEKLLWMGQGSGFELAIEARIPESIHPLMAPEKQGSYTHMRYEIAIGLHAGGEIGLDGETLWLFKPTERQLPRLDRFPTVRSDLAPVLLSKSGKGRSVAIKKNPGGNDNFYPEGAKKTYNPSFKLGRRKSALAHLPADAESFPVCSWFRTYLEEGVQPFVLNSQIIRKPSPPGLQRRFRTDGSNLPWVVATLKKDPRQFQQWLAHVRTALGDIEDIQTVERPEDRHCYLVIHYTHGAKVPSWLVSDGTLRLLALTIPAYLPAMEGTFLIEEPENGIHPRALETVLQSLTSLYSGQVLLATHSPVALGMLDASQILCFAKDPAGGTDVVVGHRHPALRDWQQGEPDLGVLFASGILS